MNYCKVILAGRLCADPEIREVGKNTVTKMRVAYNRRTKIENEWTTTPVFMDAEMWGKKGEAIANYLEKGDPIFLEGEIKQDNWEDKETGAKRSRLFLGAYNFEFVGGNNGDKESDQ